MKYSLTDDAVDDLSTPCLVVSLARAKVVAQALDEHDLFAQASQDFKDDADQTLTVHLPGKISRLLVIGGADQVLKPEEFRKLISGAARALCKLPIKQAVVALEACTVSDQTTAEKLQSAMQSISHAAYRYTKHKSKPAKPATLTAIKFLVEHKKGLSPCVKQGNALDAGMALSRDLGNEPPNICNPAYLLSQAQQFADHPKVVVSYLDEKQMTAANMGAFMSVSRGSDVPGYMIIIEYKGGKPGDAPIALVGKGITFDTGGISLKPPPGMDEMKFDMGGAAAVLGATEAVIAAGLKLNLITVVAAAENMPSGRASRPGDIVTSASGKTIEILNTDAEGRLVLCDALTHVQTFKPKTIIDVATLTGACVVALGAHASGLYANNQSLADDLLKAGQASGDKAWQMPLWDEYHSALQSNFADMANVGGRNAGSVTAACFLSEFVKDVDWAHMDVAGSAFLGGAKKGATGRPVPLLFAYLCEKAG
ncbi:MAG: leucyl aminopeptidase [Gammaproteobacteria bacterium]|jgi:leucyl aminopeptidase|nr:leucyl aminopeptidase [Gammaproteobacteria bacterium]MCH1550019.1 leucyl aminopeptidase [Pseudomonadales bacterium]